MIQGTYIIFASLTMAQHLQKRPEPQKSPNSYRLMPGFATSPLLVPSTGTVNTSVFSASAKLQGQSNMHRKAKYPNNSQHTFGNYETTLGAF